MSTELDTGVVVYDNKSFRVYANMCDEFEGQVDSVRVTFGFAEIFHIKPSEAKTDFQHTLVEHAIQAAVKASWDKRDCT